MTTQALNYHSERKDDRLYAGMPQSIFLSLFQKELYLFPQLGFKPINVNIEVLKGNNLPSILNLEYSSPPFNFLLDSQERNIQNFDKGSKSFLFSGNAPVHNYGICAWETSGISLIGGTGIVSGNAITLQTIGSNTTVLILASATKLKNPIFRLRRVYDSAIVDEVVAVADGTSTAYDFTLANMPICPSSVSISFTDAVGLKTAKIRDNGYGIFGSIPQVFYLGTLDSTIDYISGVCHVEFSSTNKPVFGSQILVSYEYNSTGLVDNTEYKINWNYDY